MALKFLVVFHFGFLFGDVEFFMGAERGGIY